MGTTGETVQAYPAACNKLYLCTHHGDGACQHMTRDPGTKSLTAGHEAKLQQHL